MLKISLLLQNVECRRTGHDGGHLYLKGMATFPGYGATDVYAYFRNRSEEVEFEQDFLGGDVLVEAEDIEYSPGIGATVREITTRKLGSDPAALKSECTGKN